MRRRNLLPLLCLLFIIHHSSFCISPAVRVSNIHAVYNTRMAQHPDVLILGGGVIGLSTAYFLTQAGARVEVLDKGDLGQESSWAGAGILSPAPPVGRARTPHDLLAAHSARLHPRMADQLRVATGVDNGYLQCGGWGVFGVDEPIPLRQWRDEEIA